MQTWDLWYPKAGGLQARLLLHHVIHHEVRHGTRRLLHRAREGVVAILRKGVPLCDGGDGAAARG